MRRVAMASALVLMAMGCAQKTPEERAATLMCDTLTDFLAAVEAEQISEIDPVQRLEDLAVEAHLDGANPMRVQRLFTDGCPATIEAWNAYDRRTFEEACELRELMDRAIADAGGDVSPNVCPPTGQSALPTSEAAPSPTPTPGTHAQRHFERCKDGTRDLEQMLLRVLTAAGASDSQAVVGAWNDYMDDYNKMTALATGCTEIVEDTFNLYLSQLTDTDLVDDNVREIVARTCQAATAGEVPLHSTAQAVCDRV